MATETETIELQRIGAEPTETPLILDNDRAGHPAVISTLHPPESSTILGKTRTVIVIAQLSSLAFITSFGTGIITIGIPSIAADLKLEDSLLLWPYAVYYLTNGSCLLLGGAIADSVGARTLNLTGAFILSIFILVCGFARTGIELIMFRAIQGIASAMSVPSSISIISKYVRSGQPRNLGFACLGLSMPLGFSFGLVIGGVLIDTLGWRSGFYIGGAVSLALFAIGLWSLPSEPTTAQKMWRGLMHDIDWVGAIIACASLALLSYVFAILSANISYIERPESLGMLVASIILMMSFVAWMQYQEKRSKPALIPNSIWSNSTFSSICVMVLLCTSVLNGMEQFSSLFFQEVQGTSALGASLRILPSLIVAIFLNFATGMLVNRVPLMLTILVSTALCSAAPLLMAVINPEWPYWYDAFPAQLLAPLSGDILFTVGILVVSDVFPAKDQGLAGAVFNTFAQIGSSIGVSIMSVISTGVSRDSRFRNSQSPKALLVGYRATFWTQFGMMALALLVGIVGLRKMGKVGVKRD